MFEKDQLTKLIEVSLPKKVLENVTKKELKNFYKDIGEYVVDSMLDLIGDGVSPVNNKAFKKLTAKYADAAKGGDRLSNMQLEGDLLDALTFKADYDGVEIGWWDERQANKAYGHSTGMEGHPILDGKAPVRKLLPNDSEKFTLEIRNGIKEITQEFIDANKD